MFENYIEIPCEECPAYGEIVRVNPEHIISITQSEAYKGGYIEVRIAGTMVGSSLKTVFRSWEEWDEFTASK